MPRLVVVMNLPGSDAELLAAMQDLHFAVLRHPLPHGAVEHQVEMRVAVKRIRANDETGDFGLPESHLGQRRHRLLGGRKLSGKGHARAQACSGLQERSTRNGRSIGIHRMTPEYWVHFPSIRQTETILEQRIVTCVADVDWNLRHRTRPRMRKLAGRLVVSEDNVGNPLSFSAGKPSGHEGV